MTGTGRRGPKYRSLVGQRELQAEPAGQMADLITDGRGPGLGERHVLADGMDLQDPALRSAIASSLPSGRSLYRIGSAKAANCLGAARTAMRRASVRENSWTATRRG